MFISIALLSYILYSFISKSETGLIFFPSFLKFGDIPTCDPFWITISLNCTFSIYVLKSSIIFWCFCFLWYLLKPSFYFFLFLFFSRSLIYIDRHHLCLSCLFYLRLIPVSTLYFFSFYFFLPGTPWALKAHVSSLSIDFIFSLSSFIFSLSLSIVQVIYYMVRCLFIDYVLNYLNADFICSSVVSSLFIFAIYHHGFSFLLLVL